METSSNILYTFYSENSFNASKEYNFSLNDFCCLLFFPELVFVSDNVLIVFSAQSKEDSMEKKGNGQPGNIFVKSYI